MLLINETDRTLLHSSLYTCTDPFVFSFLSIIPTLPGFVHYATSPTSEFH